MSLYLVGIDLGTTHSVVAYVDSAEARPDIKVFGIEQLVAPGEVAARPLLPSVRYHPMSGCPGRQIRFREGFPTP